MTKENIAIIMRAAKELPGSKFRPFLDSIIKELISEDEKVKEVKSSTKPIEPEFKFDINLFTGDCETVPCDGYKESGVWIHFHKGLGNIVASYKTDAIISIRKR